MSREWLGRAILEWSHNLHFPTLAADWWPVLRRSERAPKRSVQLFHFLCLAALTTAPFAATDVLLGL